MHQSHDFPYFQYPTRVFPLFQITFSHPSIPYLSSPLLHHLLTSYSFYLVPFFSVFFSFRLTRKIRLRQIRISRQNKRFNLRQSIQRIIAESQMILDRLLGRQSQPLRDGNVVVDG